MNFPQTETAIPTPGGEPFPRGVFREAPEMARELRDKVINSYAVVHLGKEPRGLVLEEETCLQGVGADSDQIVATIRSWQAKPIDGTSPQFMDARPNVTGKKIEEGVDLGTAKVDVAFEKSSSGHLEKVFYPEGVKTDPRAVLVAHTGVQVAVTHVQEQTGLRASLRHEVVGVLTPEQSDFGYELYLSRAPRWSVEIAVPADYAFSSREYQELSKGWARLLFDQGEIDELRRVFDHPWAKRLPIGRIKEALERGAITWMTPRQPGNGFSAYQPETLWIQERQPLPGQSPDSLLRHGGIFEMMDTPIVFKTGADLTEFFRENSLVVPTNALSPRGLKTSS